MVEASWSQGKGTASPGWSPASICKEETHMWDRSTFPSCLSYYLGACRSEAETRSSFQTLTMKPRPEKTTSDSFSTAPRASPGQVLTLHLLNNCQINKRLQILLAMLSSLPCSTHLPSSFHGHSADGGVLPPCPLQLPSSPSTTLSFMQSAGQGPAPPDTLGHHWE